MSDEWVVPLFPTHHRALHGVGDEENWWKERGVDPIGHARILWWTTRFGKAPQPSENPVDINKDREEAFAYPAQGPGTRIRERLLPVMPITCALPSAVL